VERSASRNRFVDYAPSVAIGDTVIAVFMLPGGYPIKLRAEVMRRCKEHGVGLRFQRLSERTATDYPESLETYSAVMLTAWMGTKASHPHTAEQFQTTDADDDLSYLEEEYVETFALSAS
jgi:hypothetical protein